MKKIVTYLIASTLWVASMCSGDGGHWVTDSPKFELLGGGKKIGMAVRGYCPKHKIPVIGIIRGIQNDDGTGEGDYPRA